LQRDRDENVADLQRIAFDLIEADDVIAEPRRHGRGDLARLEPAQALHELRDEARLVLVDPAQIATALATERVARLALGHVLELRATRELIPHPRDVRARRGAVGGVRQPWLHDEPDIRDGGTLEVVLVLRHISGQLRVTDHAGVRKDRKSTRLNSSHVAISYAVFCLKKKI